MRWMMRKLAVTSARAEMRSCPRRRTVNRSHGLAAGTAGATAGASGSPVVEWPVVEWPVAAWGVSIMLSRTSPGA
jgi:hypothetical protein